MGPVLSCRKHTVLWQFHGLKIHLVSTCAWLLRQCAPYVQCGRLLARLWLLLLQLLLIPSFRLLFGIVCCFRRLWQSRADGLHCAASLQQSRKAFHMRSGSAVQCT